MTGRAPLTPRRSPSRPPERARLVPIGSLEPEPEPEPRSEDGYVRWLWAFVRNAAIICALAAVLERLA